MCRSVQALLVGGLKLNLGSFFFKITIISKAGFHESGPKLLLPQTCSSWIFIAVYIFLKILFLFFFSFYHIETMYKFCYWNEQRLLIEQSLQWPTWKTWTTDSSYFSSAPDADPATSMPTTPRSLHVSTEMIFFYPASLTLQTSPAKRKCVLIFWLT